jgi:hypothetical protein
VETTRTLELALAANRELAHPRGCCATLPSAHRLHNTVSAIQSQLPRTSSGLLDAFKEMVPAVLKQRHDASYYISRPLPDAPMRN